jgi:hypothetical protein
MQKGYSVPLIIILVLGLLAVPAYYWTTTNSVNFSSSKTVKGISTTGNIYASPGFSVSVTSNAETWDLVEYLCKTLEDCTSSLNSGSRWGTISGGKTDLHEVVVESSQDWDDYKYIKYYVRSGWFSKDKGFDVVSIGDMSGSKVHKIVEGGTEYQVVITPVSDLMYSFHKSAHFSDASGFPSSQSL